MSMFHKLRQLEANKTPVRVGLIGAGKFGSMYLAQARVTPGVYLVGVADLSPSNACQSLRRVGWADEQFSASSFEDAHRKGTTYVTDNSEDLISSPFVDIVIDATGHPAAGVKHVIAACRHGKHIIMVNVEADVLAGPILAEMAADAGIIYSMASGDQPALIAEMVDWARCSGFEVVCAGKGTKYLPAYHKSTPETVWSHYGFTPEQLAGGDFNPKMFNSFLDGTKSALEMAAVANGCELSPPDDGLLFPACGADDLQTILRPIEYGGVLERKGTVEVVSSIERDGRPVYRDLRWGVFVVIEGETDYVRECFKQYGLLTDSTGRFAATYKPYHLIGLELGTSVASIATRHEPTGHTKAWNADVVAIAKRRLEPGELLDGEGGFTVYGKVIPAATSKKHDAVPIGLAHGMTLKREIPEGHTISWADVKYDEYDETIQLRKKMERELM